MVGRFDIDRVGSLAQGAMGVEVVLGQHGLQLLGEIVPSGEELQIVALLRVGHRTTAKKRCSDEGLHAVLALEVLRPDAQGRFLAGVAEKLQQALDLHHILDTELKHRAGGALLAQHIPPDAAAAVQLLGKGSHALVLGLQNDAAVIEVFTKTGHRIGGGHRAAWFGDPMAQDLVFYIL